MKVSHHLFWSSSSLDWREQAVDEHLKLVQQCHSQSWPDVHHFSPWTLICSEISSSADAVELAVTFAIHHAVADGLSTVLLHSRLQESLNSRLSGGDLSPGEFDDVLQLRNDITPPPPLEELIDMRLSWPFFSKTLWNEFVPRSPFSGRPRLPYTGSVVRREPSETHMRTSTIPADSLKNVLAACKTHQTTLTALVHALITHVMTTHHPCNSGTSFVAQTSISLRPYMSKGSHADQLIGAYYTAHSHTVSATTVSAFLAGAANIDEFSTDNLIWTLARDIKQSLHLRLSTLPHNDGVGLLPYVSDFKEYWLKKVGKPRDTTWEISNLGSIPSSPITDESSNDNKCKVVQALLTQSANVAGPAFSVNLASVREGCLAFSVCWQEGVVEVELMEAVIEGAREGLGRVAALYSKEKD